MLVEPGLLALATSGDPSREEVARFLGEFAYMADLCHCNDLQIDISSDVVGAIVRLFPFSLPHSVVSLSLVGGAGPSIRLPIAEVPKWVLTMLDKLRSGQPQAYAGHEESATFTPELQRGTAVYEDEDVWMAWRDQCARYVHTMNTQALPWSLAEESAYSCFIEAAQTVSVANVATKLRVVRIRSGSSDLVSPDVVGRLTRQGVTDVRQKWENGGHQASQVLKRVLVRTARNVGLVRVVGSTERIDACAESCKVHADEEPSYVRFRISDGQMVLKGYFQTGAATEAERDCALLIIRREFRSQCHREHLHVALGD